MRLVGRDQLGLALSCNRSHGSGCECLKTQIEGEVRWEGDRTKKKTNI